MSASGSSVAPVHVSGKALEQTVAPPLRWAGGKRWLLPLLRDLIEGVEVRRYHEPFLGGAAVFLGLRAFDSALLTDTNAELISAFDAIKESPDAVAEAAAAFPNDEETYYRVRSSTPQTSVDQAARFLYLNHTSFNGIYRVNLAGVYNVPFGRRKWGKVPSVDHLRQVSERLSRATLRVADFAECLQSVGPGDLVFLDPPYTVAHNNNGFVKYNQHLFSFEDQVRLSKVIDGVKSVGAHYILTNAAHPSIAELFDKGDHRRETNRRNTIGGFNASRGAATEYLFTNLGEVQ